MSNKEAALTVVVLTDKGCVRVEHAEPGLSFIVERFTAAGEVGERIAHVRDYRFRNGGKAYSTWSLSPDQYQILCEADEDAAIYYGPAIDKPLPETYSNPKTTTQPEQLPTSGRQGTTATPPNPATAYMLKHERQLLDTPAAQRLPILYADLFENLLSDSDNPTCQGLWKELQRRGWDIEQTLPGTLSKSWSLNAPEARKLGLSCADGNRITVTAWSEQPLPEITDQIISDRTAQHYTDPARD